VRRERTIMMWPARCAGGTLTLGPDRLIWERSRLWYFTVGLIATRGPKRLEMDLATIATAPAGRLIPWPLIIYTGFAGALVGLFSGWFRQCMGVQPPDVKEAYCFAVKNVEDWLGEIRKARRLVEAGTP